ncbi:Thioesterase/thiol ester dehydrase-isomerase [Corynespora cassiicola Philippines]|uniref:Thioesterase/thiol ester dehydrase-isomerase n=1 Tax=Corynespora cassiicola Philippines TaxID=1448308 RepID=A0A2T2P7T6_CORCC|nr:Thioesterase/thiol ester dehydrase-isomerase [Corynespora cassiicola Philippines]
MPPKRPENFSEITALNELSPNTFETLHPPPKMGSTTPTAFGGSTIAIATKAAYKTVPPGYHLYSLLGHFLGPAHSGRTLKASITPIRQTRTFATRHILLTQTQPDGSERPCLVALADFQTADTGLLNYSAPPTKSYTHWRALPPRSEQFRALAATGNVDVETVQYLEDAMALCDQLFETRPCPEGIFAQTLYGAAPHLPSTQDDLPYTQRSSAEWIRAHGALEDEADVMANLAFAMDLQLSFAPLAFAHRTLGDVASCSSLEFALRIFGAAGGTGLGEWGLREVVTHVGEGGRTYSEAKVWGEGGECWACMTQQGSLRVGEGGREVKL